MNKLILTTAIALTLSGCVVGPPNYNERDRKAYNSLEETRYDSGYPTAYSGYYHDNRWHDRNYDDDYDNDDHGDYNPHNGHDHWVRHSN